jgi:3-deoxy-D-manno-octulosonic-acid transferase
VLAQTEPTMPSACATQARPVRGLRQPEVRHGARPRAAGALAAWRPALGRPVVLAASTREGEEGPLLAAWRTLPAPRPLLLLVPRHPQRFDEVAALVRRGGLRCAIAAWGRTRPPEAQADVWLGDSMGEMPLYYAWPTWRCWAAALRRWAGRT